MTIQTARLCFLPCGVKDIKNFAIKQGEFYCLEGSGRKLIQWSPHTQAVERINLKRRYCLLCYDQMENCFWALGEADPLCLYRLDHTFREVGHLSLGGIPKKKPLNLCCDSRGEGLWLCYPSELALLEKSSQTLRWYPNQDRERACCNVVLQGGHRVNAYAEDERQILEVLSSCCGDCFALCIPRGHKLLSLAACCANSCEPFHFFALLRKACSSTYVLWEYCISCCSGVTEPPCSSCQETPCPPLPPNAAVYELIHSIALEEAGIAHILNAEGEKLQKAVAMSDEITDLICVNESVKQTLTQVTLLEGLLYSKLEAMLRCEELCCAQPPPCPPPCCPCCHDPGPCP